ncbi:MAG TPA: molybdopterin biosynthesis protein [Actinomycetes bacterium]
MNDREASSPFVRDVPAAEATAAWTAARRAAGCPEHVEAVTVPVTQALGRVTAGPVWARRSSPDYDAAAMDGIAVTATDTYGASESRPLLLTTEQFDVVDTGDPMPDGRDAVVMREHVHHTAAGAELRSAVAPWTHVRSIGEDVAATELLLPAGHRLRPYDLAAAAAAGVPDLLVRRAPRVTVIPTGDEIRPVGQPLEPGEIPETNSVMLAGQAVLCGADVLVTDVVPDVPAELAAAVHAAAADSDLVIVLAGSSAGRDDWTASVVASEGVLAVHGVAVRPGHPVVLGVVDSTPVLGAPGFPVSAALTFDIFAAPLLASFEGTSPVRRPTVAARLARKLASVVGADDWVRVRLGLVAGQVVATPLPRGAGVLTSLVRADGLLVVPAGVEGHHAGEQVEVELLRGLDEVRSAVVAIGSHDLVLDLAASALRQRDPTRSLVSSNVGSLGGLVAVRDGLCHLAGSHLLDPATGTYTLPYLDRVLGPGEGVVIRLVHRQQGLLVAPGNPLGLGGVGDLIRSGVRYVNRQRGAGTRVLLDHELARLGLSADAVSGYEREESTHLAVAAAVTSGRADAGLGILAAARAFGLDFVPVTEEPYDLVTTEAVLATGVLDPLLELMADPAFRSSVEALGGYSTAETGRRIR